MSQKKMSTKHEEIDRLREGHRKSSHQRDDRHSPLDKHSRSESHHNSKSSDKYDRNVGHYRKHDNRSNDKFKKREFRSDRREGYRRDDRNRKRHESKSRSRSTSRSRERHSHTSSSRRDYKIDTKKEPTVEKVVINESKPDKGVQHKNSLEIMRQQIRDKTGITVPEYYNPGVVNPMKFAEQEKKRKMLWSRDDNNDNKPQEKKCLTNNLGTNPWNNLKFEGEKGNAMTEKFRKLMGIKDNSNSSALSSEDNKTGKKNQRNESAIKSQETLFRDLDLQYAIARVSTHTQRGVGLGFGISQSYGTSRSDK